jgi:predicted MFS family arabinose efflux permease
MNTENQKLWSANFIIICAAYFLLACSFFLLMPTIPVFLSEKLNVEPSKIGLVLSSYAVALLIIRPFCGFWVDIFNRKKLLLVGVACFVAIYVGYYYAATVLFFVILRFVHGLFWALSTVSANTVAIDIIPSHRRAEGIGYFGINTNIAMAIAPYIAVNIYESFGFQALITMALIMGSLSIVTLFFLKLPIRVPKRDHAPISLDRFILVKAIPILINQLFLSFGWGTLVAFAVLYGKEIHISNAGLFFLFLAGGIVLSRISSGRFVDKGYIHQVMVLALFVISVGFICFSLFHNIFSYCFAAFIIGVGYGTLFPALQTIYINMAPASKRGTANSTYLTGFDLGIGLGMLFGAVLADHLGYDRMYLVTAGLCLFSLVVYLLNSKKVYERNKLIS